MISPGYSYFPSSSSQRMAPLKVQSLFLLLTSLAICQSGPFREQLTSPAAGKPPHIVLILVDDWGWANVGYHREVATAEVSTPNIDSLVHQGIELDQHYVYRFCSPSRSCLMSGRLPIHVNIENAAPNVYNPADPVSGMAGIPRNMTGIATKLKAAGYATHHVGKWDAGMATPDHTPTGRGFDTTFGYFHHANDYYTENAGGCQSQNVEAGKHHNVTDLWSTNGPASSENGTDYEGTLFKKHVMQVLTSHDPSSPLFLYYAPHIVHTPLQITDEYYDKYAFINDSDTRRRYHAMVAFLDDVIGNITQQLHEKNMWNDTLIVASADNGGPVYPGGGANNYPLRGGKVSNWQGGVRVNAFASGGFLPEEMRGQKLDGYVHLADWYGTFCSLAGVDAHDKRAEAAGLPPVDSYNMWPMLSGQNKTSPRTQVPLDIHALIADEFKIITGPSLQAGWTGPHYPNATNPKGGIDAVVQCGDGCLFNIKEDPEERNNLASTMPDKLKEMQKLFRKVNATYFDPNRGKAYPGACETAINKYGDFWGPFIDI